MAARRGTQSTVSVGFVSHLSVCCAALCFVALTATPTCFAGDIYVSPDGSDSNPGTIELPLATIASAQQAVRKQQHSGVTVFLRAGTYYLSEICVFDSRDSGSQKAPVTYSAYKNEQPVISGGIELSLEWKPYRGEIVQSSVPDNLSFDQLFVNGQRQYMARYPNYDEAAQYFQGASRLSTSPQRVQQWSSPAGGFVHAMHRSLWGDMHWKIIDKTETGDLHLEGGWQNNRQMGAHDEYRFVENILEELDAPGEWYYDRKNNQIYFYPPSHVNLATARFVGVRLKTLFEFRGQQERPVKYVTLRGIKLTHTVRTFMENKEPLLRSDWTTYRGGAVLINGAEDCMIEDCTIDQVGGNAVFVNKYNRRIKIIGCEIANAGASGVSFVGDPAALRL